MRAREPGATGFIERDGVRVAYEIFGGDTDEASPTLLFMPTWSIISSQSWKAQVPYFARHYRVITFDGRGSGRSDRPTGSKAYRDEEFVSDALAVMDETGTTRALLVSFSSGVPWSLQLAIEHPHRILGIVAIGSSVNLVPHFPEQTVHPFDERISETAGWAKWNKFNWLEGDYDDFLQFFFGLLFSEPHSTKQIEDCIGWGREIPPARLVDSVEGKYLHPARGDPDRYGATSVPVLVIHGDDDRIQPYDDGVALAEATRGSLVTVVGGGHAPHVRDPIVTNRLIKEFVDRIHPTSTRTQWVRPVRRPKRALYISSPIGLGHARRDLAIADELRKHHPDLQIDWLAQHPVTKLLGHAGERVHPASAWLASESAHIEDEAAEHDLHAFQAIRRMDSILVNNFMVFDDLVSDEPYDLVIGDEAWEVDYFLHENPESKRFAYAWMTDFVGWLPMPDGGEVEKRITADYNAEMIEHRARFRRLRDRSIFVGSPDDIGPFSFGPGLPTIRDWTEENFEFAGYVSGFEPITAAERARVRTSLGYDDGDLLCIVTVGGSAVGSSLLRRVLDAVPVVRQALPRLKFLVVAGPRIDPESLPAQPAVEIRGYLPDLHRHLGASDIAIVQGGLTTCMELTAQRVPFLYVPLRHHFEQNFHVRHRLERYGAGRCVDYDTAADPVSLAGLIAEELRRPVNSVPVETTGAARAATLLAELL